MKYFFDYKKIYAFFIIKLLKIAIGLTLHLNGQPQWRKRASRTHEEDEKSGVDQF